MVEDIKERNDSLEVYLNYGEEQYSASECFPHPSSLFYPQQYIPSSRTLSNRT